MGSPTKQYNVKKVVFVYGGVPVGLAQSIKFTPSAPVTTSTVLVDGTEVVNVSSDNSGEFEVTLAQASASNDYLSIDVNLTKTLGTVVFKTVLLKDINGTSLLAADQAYVTGFPEVSFEKDSGNRVWKIRASDVKTLVGGHV
jgi:hypothetical protein